MLIPLLYLDRLEALFLAATKTVRRAFGVGLLGGIGLGATVLQTASAGPPTIVEYVEQVGPSARIVPYGQLKIAGRRVACGRRPSVMDPTFDSWGGAYPDQRYIILNPRKLRGLAPAVKLYVYAHECGHQFRGYDEDTADCFAIRRGVLRGWLDDTGMDQVCRFISTLKGDYVHPPGPVRCTRMRACYKKVVAKKAEMAKKAAAK